LLTIAYIKTSQSLKKPEIIGKYWFSFYSIVIENSLEIG